MKRSVVRLGMGAIHTSQYIFPAKIAAGQEHTIPDIIRVALQYDAFWWASHIRQPDSSFRRANSQEVASAIQVDGIHTPIGTAVIKEFL